MTTGVGSGTGLIELLDCRLHFVVISPHYGSGINDVTPASSNTNQQRTNGSNQERMVANLREARARQEQVMEEMLAKMEANQGRMDANLREARAPPRAMMEEMLAKMEAKQERMDANLREARARQEQMMEEMLAKMEANQVRMDANIRDARARQEKVMEEMLAKMEDNQERMDMYLRKVRARQEQLMEEILAKMEVNQERMDANLREGRTSQEQMMEEMLAKMEAKIETNHEKIEVILGIFVGTGRALSKWHGNWNLALGRCGKQKERTQGNGCCRNNLFATRRSVTCREECPSVRDTSIRDQTRTMLQ
jgi:hypothetical protein